MILEIYSLYLGNCSCIALLTYVHVGINGFLKNLALKIEQNHSNLSLLGYSRYLSNLLCQIIQTKILGLFLVGRRPPKGCNTWMCYNKSHFSMPYPG